MSLSVLFFGILNAVSVLVSHQYGAKNDNAISRIMGQSLILGAIICVIMMGVLFTMPFFLRFSAQPSGVLHLAYDYMIALLWTVPALILLIIFEQFLAGINRAKIVLRISILIVPVEIVLIYLLIFGKGGLPKCGVASVGYGFATTYTLTAIGLIVYFLRAKYYHRFAIFSRLNTIDGKYLKELIYVGLPMGFMHLIEVSTFALATFWLARFGTTLLAAHQIVLQYLGFVATFIFAISQAVTVRVGHAIGREDGTRVYYGIIVGIILSTLCMMVVSSAFYFFPHFFLSFDINLRDAKNESLIRDASMLLSICAILILFDNFRIIIFGALRGLKDTKFPMLTSLLTFWLIGLSSAFLFGFTFTAEGKGIWWGLTLGIASGAVVLLCRLCWLLKKTDLKKLAHVVN